MAKKEEEPKTVLERTYNVPLRRRFRYVPQYKKAKKAVTTLKVFLIKHMKPASDEKGRIQLKIGKYLNDALWKHGMKNPPHHIKITATKNDKGVVFAELEGAPVAKPKEEKGKKTKEEKKEVKKEETKEKKEVKPKESSKEEVKEEKPKAKEKAPEVKKEEPKTEAPKEPKPEEKEGKSPQSSSEAETKKA